MVNSMQSCVRSDCAEIITDGGMSLSKLRGECILITGGTGFFGTWLTEMISFLNDEYNFNVKIFLLSQGAYNFGSKAPHLAIRKDIKLIEKDIKTVFEIPNQITYIIHAAGNPDNRMHASDPIITMNTIAKGTNALLAAACRLPNLKIILNVSSGLIYGPQPQNMKAIPEKYSGSYDCYSVASVYSEAKRFAETLCAAYASQYKMSIITARPFAFIGPYQFLDKPWAINNFIRDSLMGGPIRILGDGETVRSYMYASDMAYWMLRLLVDGRPGLAYNVGSPHGVSLNQLAIKIANNFTVKPEIMSRVSPSSHIHSSTFVPDVGLAVNTLGLEQKIDIDEAIKRTLSWYKVTQVK